MKICVTRKVINKKSKFKPIAKPKVLLSQYSGYCFIVLCINLNQVKVLEDFLKSYHFSVDLNEQEENFDRIYIKIRKKPYYYKISLKNGTYSLNESNVIDICRLNVEKRHILLNFEDFVQKYLLKYGYIVDNIDK